MITGKFAALHGGLIARKGEAVPASAMMNAFQLDDTPPRTPEPAPAAVQAPAPEPAPATEPVSNSVPESAPAQAISEPQPQASRDEEQVREMQGPPVKPEARVKARAQSPGAKMKAITLRMDPAKYRRMQVAAAKEGTTAQDLLRDAVDRQLAYMGKNLYPDCQCIRGDGFCS